MDFTSGTLMEPTFTKLLSEVGEAVESADTTLGNTIITITRPVIRTRIRDLMEYSINFIDCFLLYLDLQTLTGLMKILFGYHNPFKCKI